VYREHEVVTEKKSSTMLINLKFQRKAERFSSKPFWGQHNEVRNDIHEKGRPAGQESKPALKILIAEKKERGTISVRDG